MGNTPLKKAQVILEFALAFIIIVIFFMSAFKIWLTLSANFVTDTTSYQEGRVVSGQGNVTVPTFTTMPLDSSSGTDDPDMQDMVTIAGCQCIDGNLRDQLITLYAQKIELKAYRDGVQANIDALEEAKDGLEQTYELVPVCQCCCTCVSHVAMWCCGWFCIDDYDSENLNWADPHNALRYDLRNELNDLEGQIDTKEGELASYNAQIAGVDAQIAPLKQQASCCF